MPAWEVSPRWVRKPRALRGTEGSPSPPIPLWKRESRTARDYTGTLKEGSERSPGARVDAAAVGVLLTTAREAEDGE